MQNEACGNEAEGARAATQKRKTLWKDASMQADARNRAICRTDIHGSLQLQAFDIIGDAPSPAG